MARKPALGERLGADHTLAPGEVLGAIDVGTNAVRLKLARVLRDGSFEPLHQERDPIRPGEGVWETGAMQDDHAAALVECMASYAAICRRFKVGHLRAVATSALREAKNRDRVVERVRGEAGIELEVVSGQEEARLIALGVLRGMPAGSRSLLIDVGGGSTEIALGRGEEPEELWSVPLGAVRLTSMFGTDGEVGRERLADLRQFAQRVVAEVMPARLRHAPRHALGSSGTVRAVCHLATRAGSARATRESLSAAVEELVTLGPGGRRKRFEAQRAEVLVAGAAIVEAMVHHLEIETLTAVDGGLKEGLLVDPVRRSRQRSSDPLLSEAVIAAGRRFAFDEAHAIHTRDVALALFDQLHRVHQLPPDARLLLEVAAVLHDVGHVVSRSRHHKHSLYLIQNMDLPGLSDHERDLAGIVARFHRRSAPRPDHPLLEPLPAVEVRLVRKLATLLRLADATDRSRQQSVQGVEVSVRPERVQVRLQARGRRPLPTLLAEEDAALFRAVFGRRLTLQGKRSARS
jgi:exopolyphosphatase/guanosine-5'-triphosphate,3'-diphosphate pyrophosphatase